MIQGILNGMFEVNSDVNKLQLLAHVELRMPEQNFYRFKHLLAHQGYLVFDNSFYSQSWVTLVDQNSN